MPGTLLTGLLDHLRHLAVALGLWRHCFEKPLAASLDGLGHEAIGLAVEPVVMDGIQDHLAHLVGILTQRLEQLLESLELLLVPRLRPQPGRASA